MLGFSLISQVARGRKIGIQSRGSGRMVEESMGSLGIDSRCLDIRVTAGREEERSTTKLLVGKKRTRPPFVHFYWSRIRIANERPGAILIAESTSSRVYGSKPHSGRY